jgi:hypothetical protein
MPSHESCLRACRKLDKCDLPKPVWRARSETLRVPRCILRSNSTRRRSCIWVKFICGKSASSHGDVRSQFSFSKPICVFRASFSRFSCTSNRTNEELCLAALTQKIQLSTLGLLQLAQVVGNSRGCGSFAQSNEGCSYPCSVTGEPIGRTWGRPVLANPRRHFGNMPQTSLSSLFQILRAQHDDNHSSSTDGKRTPGR